MELARRIKEHRERLGMSQSDLAKAVFVTRQTISNWETARTYPDVQSLVLLSGLFGVSVDALVREDTQEMRDALAAASRRLNRLGLVMVSFGVACVVWVALGLVFDLDLVPIAVPAAILFIPAAAAAFLADITRHDNQLFAYQAVDALLAGEDPDVGHRYNQRVGEHWVARRVVQTILAVLIGLCCGWGAASIVMLLLGK
ncbi:helix-turn-helix transcriptional regulator [Collinsella sp. An2]|uniref:helix-turn-helix transcriptional regulator n=1 Tax=Collinsella sp. An2 TaxID=1965585 RepID=UPI001302D249|nr:helix-turn-helix transcriptional regulator [Collinsella sp. An2]